MHECIVTQSGQVIWILYDPLLAMLSWLLVVLLCYRMSKLQPIVATSSKESEILLCCFFLTQDLWMLLDILTLLTCRRLTTVIRIDKTNTRSMADNPVFQQIFKLIDVNLLTKTISLTKNRFRYFGGLITSGYLGKGASSSCRKNW